MSTRDKYLLELLNTYKSKDVDKQLSDFRMITSSLFTLTQSLFDNNEQVKYFHSELENKFFRFGLANHSIINLMQGNQFKIIDIETRITDLFAIFSLTRMQIESYSLIFYLFFDKISDKEKDFRYDIYKLNGLLKQCKFKARTQTSIEKKEIILKEIESIKQQITNHEIFKASSQKEQKDFLNPRRAMLNFSKELLLKSGLEKSRIDEMWDLYSNHAHGEYISDRQFNSIYKISKSTKGETILAININSILTSKLCVFLRDNFEGAKKKYSELDTRESVHIEIWSKMYN